MSAKYEFIDAEKDNYPIRKMCAWAGVSKSGFYDWRDRPASATARRREDLKALIEAIFHDSDGTYGHRRIHAELARAGVSCSPGLVRQLMRDLSLQPCQPRPWRPSTTVAGGAPAPDLVGRDFTADAPGVKLVGDITYIHTWAGWLYLATVIDCCTRQVVGWSMADHMRTSLVCDAITMAAGRGSVQPGAVFHSDRGSQYTSAEFRSHLGVFNMRGSMGVVGQCWDNAMAESFFAALKNELVYRTVFPTITKARRAVADYIEVFYNRTRLHSGLGYKAPAEVAAEFHQISANAA